jgi:hypothetical protein
MHVSGTRDSYRPVIFVLQLLACLLLSPTNSIWARQHQATADWR